MDKSLIFNPVSIKTSLELLFNQIMTNQGLKDLKNTLASFTFSMSLALSNAKPALALQGTITYGRFLEYVRQNLISQVKFDETEKLIQYKYVDGGIGYVNLVKDDKLL